MHFVAHRVRPKATVRHFAELSLVTLAHAVRVDGRPLAKGSVGTVVAAYHDGNGYEVEFEHPFHAVVTLEAGDLTA